MKLKSFVLIKLNYCKLILKEIDNSLRIKSKRQEKISKVSLKKKMMI